MPRGLPRGSLRVETMGSVCEIIILSRNSVGYSLYFLFPQRDYDIVSHSVAISHLSLPETHPFREDVRSLQCRAAGDFLSKSFDRERKCVGVVSLSGSHPRFQTRYCEPPAKNPQRCLDFPWSNSSKSDPFSDSDPFSNSLDAFVELSFLVVATLLLRVWPDSLDNTRVLRSGFRFHGLPPALSDLKIPVSPEIKVIVQLAALGERIDLLQRDLFQCVRLVFPINAIGKGQFAMALVPSSEELKHMVVIESDTVLNRSMQVQKRCPFVNLYHADAVLLKVHAPNTFDS